MRVSTERGVGTALILFLAVFASCGDDDGPSGVTDEGGAEVRFETTPVIAARAGATARNVLTENYVFQCVEMLIADCPVNFFEDVAPNHAADWMSFPRGGGPCAPFIAELTVGESHYSFTGTIQREFGQGAGPFSVGNYTKTTSGLSSEFGTYSFYEQTLRITHSDNCMN